MFVNFEDNLFNDDPTIKNYLALLACILNENISLNRVFNLFEIHYNEDLNIDKSKDFISKNKNFRKIKVLDTLSNKEIIFNSVYEAELYTGVKKENIYVYIKREILGKRRYKFRYYEI